MIKVFIDFIRLYRIKRLERKLQEGPLKRAKLKKKLTKLRDKYEYLCDCHKERAQI